MRLERDNAYKCLVCQYEQNQIPQTILTPLAPASLFRPFCSLGIPWAQSPLVTEVTCASCFSSEVAQLCPTLCYPMDWSLIFQARIQYWSGLPFPSPGESSRPRDQTQVSCILGRRFTLWATREAGFSKVHLKYHFLAERLLLDRLCHQPHSTVFLYFCGIHHIFPPTV